MPRVSSWPLLALCGSRTTTRKSSLGGLRSLRLEDVDDLGRPQELVLEVDQVLGAAQRAGVGLEDRELAAGEHAVGALGDGADELHGRVALRRHGLGELERLAADGLPAQREVGGDVARRSGLGAGSTRRASRSPLLVRVLVGVVAVAGERGQVDPADERELVVDDHELLVVAVHHAAVQLSSSHWIFVPFTSWSRAGLDHGAARLEDRHRRARPDEHRAPGRARRCRRAAP